MKNKMRLIVMFIVALYLVSCASIPPITQAVKSYNEGRFNESEATLKYLVETKKAKKDPSYPLLLLVLADSQFRLGDYQSSLKSYDAAIKSMTVDMSTGKVATDLLKSETNRLYRGTPHDLAFAHYYKGICYFQLGDFDGARIEFTQSRLSDQGEKAGQEDDVAIVHFMEGLCYLRLNDTNSANVSFKKVTELKPDFPFGWLQLTFTSDKLGFKQEADNSWNKYINIIGNSLQIHRDNDTSCLFLIADLGKGPFKSPDMLIGQFASYNKGICIEDGFDIALSDAMVGNSYRLDDMYFQAKSEGGLAGDVTQKVVSTVAKTAIKQFIPFGGLLVGNSGADCRTWYTLSGGIQVAILPVENDTEYVLNIKYYQELKKKGKQYLDRYEQNWYYIAPQVTSSMNPIYVISMADLHNVNIDHKSISEKIEAQNIKYIKTINKEKKK